VAKGPTKAQLLKANERLGKQVSLLRAELAASRMPDKVRREGEHWYELLEHFDAAKIERLPVKEGRAFILGRLAGLTIVEVSRAFLGDVGPDEEQQAIARLGKWLESNGIEALIVTEGVRFLKLATVAPEMEAKLDATEVKNASCVV
jgi:hypothetical protein